MLIPFIDITGLTDEYILETRKLIAVIANNNKQAREQMILPLSPHKPGQIVITGYSSKIRLMLLPVFKVHNPNSQMRIIWELISMAFIFIQMIQIPLVLTYQVELDTGWVTFNTVMDAYFLADILLNFNLAYYEKGDLVFDRVKVLLNYLRFWFWIDLIAILPYDYFTGEENSNSSDIFKIVRLLKFIKIMRLLRVLKVGKILAKIEETFSIALTMQVIIQFLKLVALILCIAHWTACVWNLIEIYDEEVEKTWNVKYGIHDAPWEIKYISSLYFSVTTMITIGYGDISPNTTTEMLFSIFAMVLASAIFGYSMSSLMQIIEGEDASVSEIKEQNQKILKYGGHIFRYIKQKKVPSQLQSRVKNYLEWLVGAKQLARNYEMKILNTLSMNLKTEVICFLNGRILNSVLLIKKTFSEDLIKKLVYVMKEQILGPEEFVFKENSNDNGKMFFIQNGELLVTLGSNHDKIIKKLGKGHYFGEIGFFGYVPRTASVKSIDFVNMMYIQRDDLWDCARNLDADTQKLFIMKYAIEHNNDLRPMKIRCYICSKAHHIARNCTLVHYRVKKRTLWYQYCNAQNERQFFIRSRKGKREKRESREERGYSSAYTNLQINSNSSTCLKFQDCELKLSRIENQFEGSFSSVEEFAKWSFNIDRPKDYSCFYPDYNFTPMFDLGNQRAEQTLKRIKDEKARAISNHLKKQRKNQKVSIVAPRESRQSLQYFQSTSENMGNKEVEIRLMQPIQDQLADSSMSLWHKLGSMNTLKGKRRLDEVQSRQTRHRQRTLNMITSAFLESMSKKKKTSALLASIVRRERSEREAPRVKSVERVQKLPLKVRALALSSINLKELNTTLQQK